MSYRRAVEAQVVCRPQGQTARAQTALTGLEDLPLVRVPQTLSAARQNAGSSAHSRISG